MGLLLIDSACASGTAPAPTTPSVSSVPTRTGKHPIAIQDCGKALTFQATPKRVITYYQPTVELMIAVGPDLVINDDYLGGNVQLLFTPANLPSRGARGEP